MDIEALEKVQKWSLRMINSLSGMFYEEKLSELNLQTLEDRRTRGDMIELFKYMTNVNKVDKDELFSFVKDRHEKDTRSWTEDYLVAEKNNLNIRKYFYTNRVTDTWNRLPNVVKEATSVNNFKNIYDEHIKMCD